MLVVRICDAEQYEEQCKKELSGSVRGLYESLVEKAEGNFIRLSKEETLRCCKLNSPKFTEAWKTFMFTHT